jgi:DNA primase
MEGWISFEEVKKAVSLEMVIKRYGFPLRASGPYVLRGKCPLPTHGSDKSKESFIATLNKGMGGAWSCHSQSCVAARGGKRGGNVLDLVAAIEVCSIRDAALKIQSWFPVPAAAPESVPARHEPAAEASRNHEPQEQLVSKETEGEGSQENKPLTFALKSVDASHSYLRERGLTPETVRAFGIGYFLGKGSMQGRVVIPIHNKRGELVAYAGRTIDGSEPRYKFPVGFRKSLELYNLHRVQNEEEISVVLVEGFFGCMHVTQAGFPCVALMGSTMSEAQEALLAEHFGQVVVMLDGDNAGREAVEEIEERLRRLVYQVSSVQLPNGVQPDQLSREELVELLR